MVWRSASTKCTTSNGTCVIQVCCRDGALLNAFFIVLCSFSFISMDSFFDVHALHLLTFQNHSV